MNIGVINTGGTISCVGNPLSPMSAQAFGDACRKLIDSILKQQFPNLQINYVADLAFPESKNGALDSTNLQPTDWCLMARYILDHYNDYDGWVLLHGTDSMDFTGAALGFLLSSFSSYGVATGTLSKPVIITGSQTPLFYQASSSQPLAINYNTDAFQNICGAVAAAQSGIPEVCVYFQNKLYRGNRVLKTNASEFNAFSAPNYPPLGEYGVEFAIDFAKVLPPPVHNTVSLDNPAVLSKALAQIDSVAAAINNYPVMQFNAFPAPYNKANQTGLLASLLGACVSQGLKGIILESYGEGNFPSGNPDSPKDGAIYQALQKANASGVVIMDCTQVIAGIVNNSAYAAGAWLPEVGAINPADMTPMAALAKLTVLLAAADFNGWSLATVKTLMQLNLMGEMRSVNRLDSRTNPILLPTEILTALDGSATLVNDPVQGPMLVKGSNGETLWKALPNPPAANRMPGQLIMQNDGNLVFYSRNNSALWATNTGHANGASSILSIDGSFADGTLVLQVFNYSDEKVSAVLFTQPHSHVTEQGQSKAACG